MLSQADIQKYEADAARLAKEIAQHDEALFSLERGVGEVIIVLAGVIRWAKDPFILHNMQCIWQWNIN